MPPAVFVYDHRLSTHVLSEGHVMRPTRLRYTYELLEAYGVFRDRSLLVKPRLATRDEVLTFHTPDYVDAVRRISEGDTSVDGTSYNITERGDNPPYRGMYEAALLSTGASLVAVDEVLSGRALAAFNVSGGLHHAMAGHAAGFCIFNDPAVAIKAALRQGRRVAYVDIDCHHGDGVQAAFYDTDQVLTVSLHESGRWLYPGTGEAREIGAGRGESYSVNLPLAPYTTDDTYLWAFREVVPPLLTAFKPDLLVTQLGVDTHYTDPITHMALTTHGFTACVQEFRAFAMPWVALGGGGYDISAVARCWTLAFAVMAGLDLPDDIPASYRGRYGLQRLHDVEEPRVDAAARDTARSFAEKSVAEIKRLIFPRHGLPKS